MSPRLQLASIRVACQLARMREDRRARELRCPTCRAPVEPPREASPPSSFPFCSERCRLLDLGGWLDERFRVAGSEEEDARSLPESPIDRDRE